MLDRVDPASGRPPDPRQCGRCRQVFPGDPNLFPGTIPDWWLCTPCRSILLPATHPTAAAVT